MALSRKVARDIVRAQISSDAGKHIHILDGMVSDNSLMHASDIGYSQKDIAVLHAISEINKRGSKATGFSFYVNTLYHFDGTQYCNLVYFTFHIEGKRYQISFHCFNEALNRYSNNNPDVKQHWDHKRSRKSAEALIGYFGF